MSNTFEETENPGQILLGEEEKDHEIVVRLECGATLQVSVWAGRKFQRGTPMTGPACPHLRSMSLMASQRKPIR